MSPYRLIEYDVGQPLYGVGFSNSVSHPHRVALTSLVTGPTNKLYIADLSHPPDTQPSSPYYPQANNGSSGPSHPPPAYRQLTSTNINLPATKVGWEPEGSVRVDQGGRGELVATTGESLHLWEVAKGWTEGSGHVGHNGWGNERYTLKSRSILSNTKGAHGSLPPVTSFSWNNKSPNKIVTCSIDTTATLWDINTAQAMTQLIAHDRAVYDLCWLPDSSDIFVSVGADGSLRAFDLRQLEHSTILYESSRDAPLARIAFSKKEQHMLACFGLDDSKILILDMRSPGKPVAELIGHQAPLGAIAWGSGGTRGRRESTGGGWLASCGDDSQLLLYDLTAPLPTSRSSSRSNFRNSNATSPYVLSPSATPSSQRTPSPADAVEMMPAKGWTARGEINNLAFTNDGDWVGCVTGTTLKVLHV
ncbi:transparent testa glabra 1 protein (ttg1 protein), putative [Cryptococcus deneoformans JEC21]|uniref:Transparent testa glabra 1 protein (Ttg1 protein), putative n=1 Tax=Cryptococcus deneoformans (strain JEC21 / ATCC MYA-565) TaxID=214684 RepID=Q5KFJ2_CRYD1|nr:transparent testa glabra 1 protein (ttg1 protein), putative [Cryptococcus neoformans var. neoformans JEC21]AAW44203.1 transparent testa glabra 1 protein (ttg1 protein), putative [Cryptococcus neoformans var. neoformans JEC21]